MGFFLTYPLCPLSCWWYTFSGVWWGLGTPMRGGEGSCVNGKFKIQRSWVKRGLSIWYASHLYHQGAKEKTGVCFPGLRPSLKFASKTSAFSSRDILRNELSEFSERKQSPSAPSFGTGSGFTLRKMSGSARNILPLSAIRLVFSRKSSLRQNHFKRPNLQPCLSLALALSLSARS